MCFCSYLRSFLPHHSNSIVQWLVSQLPHRQPSGPVLTALHLTFHHGHPTITDIVLVCSQSLIGPVTLPHAMLLLLLLLQKNCWIKPAVSGWTHTKEPVWHDDFLSLMCHVLLVWKGHTSLHWGHRWFSSVSLHSGNFLPTSVLFCSVVVLFQLSVIC